MRRWAEGWVRRWWAGESGPLGLALSVTTVPLELLFRSVVGVRNRAFQLGLVPADQPPVPVVSVGNLTVGGTGKTPVAGWIARSLQRMDERPAVVTSGYGRDELELHRRWNPQVPAVGDRRRAKAVREVAEAGATVVVLDDGFQHRALARDLDVVLLAAEAPFPPRLLPRGPYREPLQALARADLVVLTRRTTGEGDTRQLEETVHRSFPGLPVSAARLVFAGWTDLAGIPSDPPPRESLAVASVARPEAFRRTVRAVLGSEPSLVAFPDHHEYSPAEVRALGRKARGRALVTTEKDAVKLIPYQDELPPTRVLRLDVQFGDGGEALRTALQRALDSRRGPPHTWVQGSGVGGRGNDPVPRETASRRCPDAGEGT